MKIQTTIKQELQHKGDNKNIFTSIAARLASFRRDPTERALFIETYPFPGCVRDKLKELYPDRSDQDIALVLRGLRDWFRVCLAARGRFVSMPSRIVDDAWHAFILDTRAYEYFCAEAFGRFVHHTPAEDSRHCFNMRSGLLRAWRHAAVLDHQDPKRVDKLPLLFGIDAQLAVANGSFYALDWHKPAPKPRSRDGGACGSGSGTVGCGSGGSSCGSSGTSCGSSCGSGCGGGCGGGS
jgi:hypothetical protein